MKKDYAVLHAHSTTGSIGDSILKIDDYVKKAKELGISALALTDHGSISSFVYFYKECLKNKIKPIIGCEFYYVDDSSIKDKSLEKRYHLILLCKNSNGLSNLIKLHNESHDVGFYYKPRVDLNMIRKYHKDLICLTACVAGKIPQLIINDNENIEKEISLLQDIFKDDLYFEIQPGKFSEQKKVNNYFCNGAYKIVATNDIHYLNASEYMIHNHHVKNARKDYTGADDLIYPDTVYYLMSRKELLDKLVESGVDSKSAEKSIDITLEIADKTNLILDQTVQMPSFFDSKEKEDAELFNLCFENLKALLPKISNPSDYYIRLCNELKTIKELGFSGYFLIVKDFIENAKSNHVAIGPGRGSAAGSLVSYLLGISIADPVKYDLMFERFLSVKRKSIPDIDIDADSGQRNIIYNHIIEKYGSDHCCFVGTLNFRKARSAIKDAARILNIDKDIADKIAKTIPMVTYESGEKQTDLTIDEALDLISDFKNIAQKYPKLIETAKKIERYPTSAGIHPAGIVISPMSLSGKVPLIRCKNDLLFSSSLDLDNIQDLGYVKFDILALGSLAAIDNTQRETGFYFDYSNEELFNDPEVWKLIGSKNTTGLFQISSKTYKTRMPKLKPKTIQELAACLALVRAPCISSGADKEYIDILSGRKDPQKIHEIYWNITKNTCGIVIYQEQVLKLCQAVGFDSETSYWILKGITKKHAEKVAEYEKEFYQLASKKMDLNIAKIIWARILDSAKYAFNISHAISYALLCYCSAYLKVHYPLEYMTNLLSKEYSKSNSNNIQDTIDECRRIGIEFLMPDINKSSWNFTVEKNKIRIGMSAIKGFGDKAFKHVSSLAPFETFEDFIQRAAGSKCNKKAIEYLIIADTFKELTGYKFLDLLTLYIFTIRKEDCDFSIKIGTELVDLFQNPSSIKTKILCGNYNKNIS